MSSLLHSKVRKHCALQLHSRSIEDCLHACTYSVGWGTGGSALGPLSESAAANSWLMSPVPCHTPVRAKALEGAHRTAPSAGYMFDL